MGTLRTNKLALSSVNLDTFIADLSSDLCMFMVTVGVNFEFVFYECLTPSRTTFDCPDMLSNFTHGVTPRFNMEPCQ